MLSIEPKYIMSKPFKDALDEWKKDNKYFIGDDIGDEFYDYLECPMHSEGSLAKDNGTTHTTKEVVD